MHNLSLLKTNGLPLPSNPNLLTLCYKTCIILWLIDDQVVVVMVTSYLSKLLMEKRCSTKSDKRQDEIWCKLTL